MPPSSHTPNQASRASQASKAENPSLPTLPALPTLPKWFLGHFQNENAPFLALLERFVLSFRISHSQTEQLCKMAKDLADWRELPKLKTFLQKQLQEQLDEQKKNLSVSTEPQKTGIKAKTNTKANSPEQRQKAFAAFASLYSERQRSLPNFQHIAPKPKMPKYQFEILKETPTLPQKNQADAEENAKNGDRILGTCPVASIKTRCCNLLTLDAIQQCGFGCSYCAIQDFYKPKAIQVRSNFAEKLEQIQLDPERWYHIGTGQASDSLLWSDKLGIAEPLIQFARRYPRVILELKSKSANIQDFMQYELPPNMLFTWSLNPNSFIQHEEPLTAPLDARLRAARQMADKGVKVGFHFHPIVRYTGWKNEYSQLIQRLTGLFAPEEVVTVSLGTLTFSKSALKSIRHKAHYTQILRFAMEESAGKYSYPYEVKLELFQHIYQAFSPWHPQTAAPVFFYLCMEDPKLWGQVFGSEYQSNGDFEQNMIEEYRNKMGLS